MHQDQASGPDLGTGTRTGPQNLVPEPGPGLHLGSEISTKNQAFRPEPGPGLRTRPRTTLWDRDQALSHIPEPEPGPAPEPEDLQGGQGGVKAGSQNQAKTQNWAQNRASGPGPELGLKTGPGSELGPEPGLRTRH